mmetsp:Transcript_20981/g.23732  ORF Transcript_20981/g.23732 Transcript_20981/m.23732 type:complete len:757 (-) Transcript_20981:57-2327(-)|eukprot:CAMPEP_0114996234 /NCGR_PEP_ID=MMETSP0216-20121206/14189_1 /TAXON_ID=223996 /ORGANISM="Protocruzia adherens, Strain Boccale" /LENGTH=756 /DNA_ID=CAMNT_0002360399 /DNA_START=37 /DNA_END=2307 /DNA_ORIENTATION=+
MAYSKQVLESTYQSISVYSASIGAKFSGFDDKSKTSFIRTELGAYNPSLKKSQEIVRNIVATPTTNFCVPACGNINVSPSIVARVFSPSKKMEVVIKSEESDGKKVLHLEVRTPQGVIAIHKLSDLIEKVYADDHFGVPKFDESEERLVFVGERKPAETTCFYDKVWEDAEDEDDQKDKKSAEMDQFDSVGNKYVYKQDFGEKFDGLKEPRLFIFDLKTGKLGLVTNLNYEKIFPAHPSFSNSTKLVLMGMHRQAFNYGIYACLNRPSGLYSISEPELKLLTKKNATEDDAVGNASAVNYLTNGFAAITMAPSVSPDKEKLAFFYRQEVPKSHNFALGIACLSLADGSIQELIEPGVENGDENFTGMFGYHDQVAVFWHSSSKYLYFSSSCYGRDFIFQLDITTKSLKQLHKEKDGVLEASNIEDIFNDQLLVTSSRAQKRPCLKLSATLTEAICAADIPDEKITWTTLLEQSIDVEGTSNTEEKSIFDRLQNDVDVQSHTIKDGVQYFSFLVRDSHPKKNGHTIFWMHGGPHGAHPINYSVDRVLFLELGFNVVGVNYRGSIGFGDDFRSVLLGHAGVMDVDDCKAVIDDIIGKKITSSNKLFLYGGSHGGYLTTHLLCQYPELAQAGVALNPVCDMMSFLSATEIPEWVHAMSRDGPLTWEPTPEILQKLYEASPIRKVQAVTKPLLLLMGDSDRRVPPLNGYLFYKSLKHHSKEDTVFLRNYPKDNHSIRKDEYFYDTSLSTVEWFTKHLSQE